MSRDALVALDAGEPFRKSADGDAPSVLRKAYNNAVEDGAIDLREAAAELDDVLAKACWRR